jgi:uncharacterized ubiquitin-like protein YukD
VKSFNGANIDFPDLIVPAKTPIRHLIDAVAA